MTKKLRKHQIAALDYSLRTPHPALFLQMRLGKTLVAIRRCKLIKPSCPEVGIRVLVVAPGSALGGWERQCEEEGQRVVWLTGTKDKRRKALTLLSSGFHLINKEGWIALPEIATYPWDAVIVDESTFVKEPRAKVTKFFLKNFRDVQMRMVMTGTPDPEGADDFFCQLAFLHGSAFGCRDYWQFRAKHMQPHPAGFGWVMKPGVSDAIRREVGRIACVMRREDVGYAEQRVYEQREFEMPTTVRKSYDKVEREFALEWNGKEATTKWAGGRWQWLRQLCGGLIDGEIVWSAKLDELLSLLTGELAGEQVVIWSCYNDEVRAIAKALTKKGIRCEAVNGATPLPARVKIEREFGHGKYRALVMQEAIARTGMDLSAADTAIYYSTPVGGFARAQTEDRILSIEKIEREVPMLFIDFVAKDSVDEDVMKLLQDKSERSDLSMSRALQKAYKERIKWTEKLKT